MTEREETLVANDRGELDKMLAVLRLTPVSDPRRTPDGRQWFVRARPARRVVTPPRSVAASVRVPRALVAVMTVGGLAVAGLLVLATAWVVRHWALAFVLAAAGLILTGKVKRWW